MAIHSSKVDWASTCNDISISTLNAQNPNAQIIATFLTLLVTQIECLGCLAVEQLEDGQALIDRLNSTERQEQGMMPLLVLGQWVDPGFVQQVLGDIGMEVPAGIVQRVVPLWQEEIKSLLVLSTKLVTFQAYPWTGLGRVHPPLLDQVPDDLQAAVTGRDAQWRNPLSVLHPGIRPCLLDQVTDHLEVATPGSLV